MRVAITVGVALGALWLALAVALLIVRPRGLQAKDALRLLPDTLRLFKRLAADPAVPRGVRMRIGLLLVYLAMPFDLIPDFVPVLGHADDVIVVLVALRSVVRHAGLETLERHWPGTADGLAALRALARA